MQARNLEGVPPARRAFFIPLLLHRRRLHLPNPLHRLTHPLQRIPIARRPPFPRAISQTSQSARAPRHPPPPYLLRCRQQAAHAKKIARSIEQQGSGTTETLKLLNAKPIPFIFEPMKLRRSDLALAGIPLNVNVHGRPSSELDESSTPSGDN